MGGKEQTFHECPVYSLNESSHINNFGSDQFLIAQVLLAQVLMGDISLPIIDTHQLCIRVAGVIVNIIHIGPVLLLNLFNNFTKVKDIHFIGQFVVQLNVSEYFWRPAMVTQTEDLINCGKIISYSKI